MRLLLLFVALCSLAACFARGGVSGELSHNVEASVVAVHQAVLDCLRANDLTIEEEAGDKMSSLVKGRYADNVLATIHSERFTDTTASITIQVGAFGDEQRSKALMEDIEQRLAITKQ